MTAEGLQNKIYAFSYTYFLPDLRKDREAFYSLAQEDFQKYPACILGVILNLFMDGKLDQANAMIEQIPENTDFRMGLNIVNPSVSWRTFIKSLQYFKASGGPMGNLVLTAGRPSLINGFNDFSRIMPFLETHKAYFIDGLDYLYGKDCSALLYNLLLAEYYYQLNKLTDSEIILSRTIKEFDKKSEYRFLFTSLYLEAKIFIANGSNFKTEQFINKIYERVTQLGKAEFSNNINAVKAQFLLYEGDYKMIQEWMDTDAPDEISDFNMLDLYRYMVKIRCYIVLEKYNAAISLIEKLRPFIIEGHRPADLCELDLLLSITLEASGKQDLALEALERTLKIARRRGFHRLISDEGTAVFKLLLEYTKIKGESDFLLSLIESTRRMAVIYPQYLKPRYKNNEQFSLQEIDILNLLQQGKSQEEIGEYFFVSVNTVKYHLKKIYSKLDAENAVQAIWNARLLGLLR